MNTGEFLRQPEDPGCPVDINISMEHFPWRRKVWVSYPCIRTSLGFGWLPGLSQDISQPTNSTFVYSDQSKWIPPFSHLPLLANALLTWNWVLQHKTKWLIFWGSSQVLVWATESRDHKAPHSHFSSHCPVFLMLLHCILPGKPVPSREWLNWCHH